MISTRSTGLLLPRFPPALRALALLVCAAGLAAPVGARGPADGEAPKGEVPEDSASRPVRKIPVILDTDIGDDIDDTWALALLLRCPELDLKLVTTDYGKAAYRARIVARLLETAGRTDVPIGLGISAEDKDGPQAAWVKDYDLSKYPGKVHEDGVKALIDTILGSPEPITLIAIGPVPTIAAALDREPRIAERTRFVGMHGSVRKGYGGKSAPDPEWNVKADASACARVLSAPGTSPSRRSTPAGSCT
jgi:inosine-uridine nucleoside N-ribohydrolase